VVGSSSRLQAHDIACWVIKTSTAPDRIVQGWAPESGQRLQRCVRPSYRLGLMAPGQRCLLWLSGREEPGVHAVGVLSGVPEDLVVEVDLHRLAEPVLRTDLLTTAAFASAEVARMPAGSNPSYLTAPQLRPLLDRLAPGELREAGWA
jgi:hypothetical protein